MDFNDKDFNQLELNSLINNVPSTQELASKFPSLETLQKLDTLLANLESNGNKSNITLLRVKIKEAILSLGTTSTPTEQVVNNNYANSGGIAAGSIDQVEQILIEKYIDNRTIGDEQLYSVSGLTSKNPYNGLRPFTYEDKIFYAGRKKLAVATLEKITKNYPNLLSLLFITGTSGSGKSSFAQAGLLPELEKYYSSRKILRYAVLRPSRFPLNMLVDAFSVANIGGNIREDELNTSDAIISFIVDNTSANQVNVIIIDQFEEFFTQSDTVQREIFFEFLVKLPEFNKLRTHIIITMRSDYLGELFKYPALYEVAKTGLDLRAMTVEELKEAIEHPIQFLGVKKQIEDTLVERLAKETAINPTYLPLLQVTLENLWNKGSLRYSAYTSLTDAIKNQAELFFQYEDYATTKSIERSPEAKFEIIEILVDLISLTPTNVESYDIRRRRNLSELTKNSLLRKQLIEQLVSARLLSTSVEVYSDKGEKTTVVDIIHESLIYNWDRLKQAALEHRELLRKREKLKQAVEQWKSNKADLLTDIHLAEARQLEAKGDIEFQNESTRDLLKQSIEAEQAKIQAEVRRRNRFWSIISISLVLLLSLVLVSFFWQEATRQSKIVQSLRLSSEARNLLSTKLDLALLLSLEAQRIEDTLEARNSIAEALSYNPLSNILRGHKLGVNKVLFSPDGKLLASSSSDGTVRLWETNPPSLKAVLVHYDKAVITGAPTDDSRAVVTSLSFSSDGKYLASAGNNKRVILWDLTQQYISKTNDLHTDAVNTVAFSPDNKYLASAGNDKKVILWELTTDTKITLEGHTNIVYSLAFSPNGKFLASGSSDTTIRLWDTSATTISTSTVLSGHINGVAMVKFSPDGKYLASAGKDNAVILWNVISGEKLATLKEHTDDVKTITFSPDSKTLASTSEDKSIILWDVLTRKRLYRLRAHAAVVNDAIFSPDGKRIVTVGDDSLLIIWDVNSGSQLNIFHQHTAAITTVAFNPSGEWLVTGGRDKNIIFWFTKNRTQITNIYNHVDGVRYLALSPNGNFLASASMDKQIFLIDARSKTLINILKEHSATVNKLLFTPDSNLLISSSEDKTVRFWDVSSGRNLKTLSHTNNVSDIVLSRDGKLLASADKDKNIVVWQLPLGKEIARFTKTHTSNVRSLQFSADNKFLISASDDKTIKLWNLEGKKLLTTLQSGSEDITQIQLSPDGQILAASSKDGSVILWNMLTLKNPTVLQGHLSMVNGITFSPDGKLLASFDRNGTIILWDVTNQKKISVLKAHIGEVNEVIFSPDSNYLASAGNDKTVIIWAMVNLNPLVILKGHTSSVNAVVFNQNGQELASASSDESVIVWDINISEWSRKACLTANRNLTQQEWQVYIGNEAYKKTCPNL